MTRAPIFIMCLTACAALSTTSSAQTVTRALTQPLRDLNIVRESPEEVLQQAATAPYAMPAALPSGATNCQAISHEILSLDIALGSDVDVVSTEATRSLTSRLRSEAMSSASNAITDGIGDLVGLPYRGVIRRLSGAERRDRDMRSAQQAGMLRRAFLKGVSARDCAEEQIFAALAPLPPLELASTEAAAPPNPVTVQASIEPAPVHTPSAPVTIAAAQAPAPSAGLQTISEVSPAGS